MPQPPRITINAELVDRLDRVEIPGLWLASRNVKARYLLAHALRQFEQVSRPAAAAPPAANDA